MQINLLPQPSPVQQTRTILLMGIAGVLILANLWIGAGWFGANSEKKQQELILQDANRRIEMLQVELEKKNKLEVQANQYQVLKDWSARRLNYRSEVHLLSSLLPEKSFLTRVEFLEERTFELQAVLPDMESVATYLRLLEDELDIENVRVQSVVRQEEYGADSGNSSSSEPQTEEYYLSWSGFWKRLWHEHVRPLFSTDIAYASDDGSEEWEEEGAADNGNGEEVGGQSVDATESGGEDGKPESGDPEESRNQESANQGNQGEDSGAFESEPVISYELNLQVTMKRDD